MKIPAIRAKMGTNIYYTTTLTFKQVSDYVSPIDDELHKSKGLKDLIQRSITSNYKNIQNYIENQPERFFNALILAVYDDYPNWREIEFTYDDVETYQMGILEFPNDHKIFPVDGQHRVEGIRAALEKNPSLGEERITAIFIAHHNDEEGMKKTRRLFSTLNRYAKPVSMNDIIALDEDDSAAIITRELLETFDLFMNERVSNSGNKAIAETDKKSFTSIITFYQCNIELLKSFRKKRKIESPQSDRDKKSLKEYLKFRPEDAEIDLFLEYCTVFWTSFRDNLSAILEYLTSSLDRPALVFRNKETGGNLLFRPVSLLPFIKAILEIHKREQNSFSIIIGRLNQINFTISNIIWKNVLWNPNNKTMIMGSQKLVKLLFLYLYGNNVILDKELLKLKEDYAGKKLIENHETALDELTVLQ